jgi:hypothetical protein
MTSGIEQISAKSLTIYLTELHDLFKIERCKRPEKLVRPVRSHMDSSDRRANDASQP